MESNTFGKMGTQSKGSREMDKGDRKVGQKVERGEWGENLSI